MFGNTQLIRPYYYKARLKKLKKFSIHNLEYNDQVTSDRKIIFLARCTLKIKETLSPGEKLDI